MNAQGQVRRTDAKAFFANERTFLHWLSTAVSIGTIAGAMGGVTGSLNKTLGPELWLGAVAARMVALVLLGVAIFLVFWNAMLFYKRNEHLMQKTGSVWQSYVSPVLIAVVMMFLLLGMEAGAIYVYLQ